MTSDGGSGFEDEEDDDMRQQKKAAKKRDLMFGEFIGSGPGSHVDIRAAD